MPTYVYKFLDTGETVEIQQAFSDDALTEAVHPTTGETKPVKKVFLPVGVTFKGGGFYKTDSRGGKASTTSAGESSSTAASTPASSGDSASTSTSSAAPAAASAGSGSSTSPAS
jgi:predicted nucleic acid-binding Zn ribbon protein